MPTSTPLTVEVESRIEATPERVWELVSDITVPARFSGELQRVEWNDGVTEPRAGARFTGHNSNPNIGEWSTTSEVVEATAPRSFAWQVVGPEEPVATWRFDLVPESSEATLLRHQVRTGPGRTPLDDFVDDNPEKKEKALRSREKELRTNMRATLDGIREACEGEAPSQS